MTDVATVLAELDSAMASHSEEQRVRTVTTITDMFINRAEAYSSDQVGVFDVVIGRLASGIGTQARCNLSERLADVATAPRGVVRQLALDEIAVAKPVLTRSRLLTDQDLIAVASTKGRDHMLVMSVRPNLGESITDYLVIKGDTTVSHALAQNRSARFSSRGLGLLVTRAFTDENLQSALDGRADIPPPLMDSLAKATRETARRRAQGEQGKTGSGWAKPAPEPTAAKAERAGVAADGQTEEDLAAVAAAGETDNAIASLAKLVGISPQAAEQAIVGDDPDACLLIGKAMGWSWTTVRHLIGLRPSSDQMPHLIDKAKENFATLAVPTAQRVLQFMRTKDKADAATRA